MADKLKKYLVPAEDQTVPVYVTGVNLNHARATLKEELARIGSLKGVVIIVTPKMLDLKEVEWSNPEVR